MSDTQNADTAIEELSPEEMWSEFAAAEGGTAGPSRGEIGSDVGDEHSDSFEDADPGDDPAVVEPADATPAEEDVDKSATAGDDKVTAAAPAPSIWDNAPPELRKEYEAVLQRERSAAGRAVGFQRRFEELKRAAEPRPVDDKRLTREAAIAAIREDYPEIAEPLNQALDAIAGDVQDLASREESRREAAQNDLNAYVQQETEAVLAEHPDYLEVLQANAPTLVSWINDQPLAMRQAFERNKEEITNGAEAAALVSAFKAHLNPPAAAPARTETPPPLSSKRERQMGSTASPASRGRRATVSGIPEDGDPQEIWDAFVELDQRAAAAQR